MKQIKTLLMLLIGSLAFSQTQTPYVGFIGGFDIKNALVGSEPTNNKSELNYSLQFIMVGKNVECGIGYESFKRIDFNRMYLSAGYQFPISEKIKLIPTLEPSIINRSDNWGGGISYELKQSFLSLALNLSLQYNLNDKLALRTDLNLLPRTDQKMMYNENKIVPSILIKLEYKINL
jgi:hypothetical protein